jgi:CheY-like chemotaxis protein
MCRFASGLSLLTLVRSAPNILLAEDEPTLRESLQDALEDAGYPVAVARNGEEALALLDSLARPALLVLDLQMPFMDGVTFLNALRQRPDHQDFEVLAMSAYVDGEWLERVPGVLRTLRKPFPARELIAAADDFLARHPLRSASASPATEKSAPVLGPVARASGPEGD